MSCHPRQQWWSHTFTATIEGHINTSRGFGIMDKLEIKINATWFMPSTFDLSMRCICLVFACSLWLHISRAEAAPRQQKAEQDPTGSPDMVQLTYARQWASVVREHKRGASYPWVFFQCCGRGGPETRRLGRRSRATGPRWNVGVACARDCRHQRWTGYGPTDCYEAAAS